MLRRLPILGGIAILAVVINHGAQWGFFSLFLWQNKDLAQVLSVPLEALTYYSLLALEKLPIFCVPAFIFISGFFAAYASRGQRMPWKMVKTRLVALLIPYLIWATIIYLQNFSTGESLPVFKYFWRLFWGSVTGPYFFTPLLCQLYLLSPWIAVLFKSRPRVILLLSGLTQLAVIVYFYIHLISGQQFLPTVYFIFSKWSIFFMWWFYFVLGMLTFYQIDKVKEWLHRFRWLIVGITITAAVTMIWEADWVYQTYGENWRDMPFTLPSTLYGLGFILTFLAFEQAKIPWPRLWTYLNAKSYGIYLIHVFLVVHTVKVYYFVPSLVAYPLVITMIAVIFPLATTLIFMELIQRSKLRFAYSYLFG